MLLTEEVCCRYLFPRDLYVEATHDGKKKEKYVMIRTARTFGISSSRGTIR